MKTKRKSHSNRVASNDGLYGYAITVFRYENGLQREIMVRAHSANDAMTMVQMNELKGTDCRGNKTEVIYSIRCI